MIKIKVMKANEVPEKIYVVDATFPDYVDFDGSPINTKRIDEHDIEYVRSDTFMEKAEKFMNTVNEYLYHCVSEECDYVDTDKFIEDFRKYMK